jgi:hypothetical protein
MGKAIRIILGIALVGIVLHLADLATRDCRLAPFVYDNCMWTGLRARLGLPESRFLRMVVLECVGILLAGSLYVCFRYVFPFRRGRRPAPDSSLTPFSEPPRD